MSETDDIEFTPAPFYVHNVFRRLGCGDCDFCMFSMDENSQEEGGCCPDNLWWYVMQRQKVMQDFDGSHPPVCPNCGKLMVRDRTITLGDKDVAAFTCRKCNKFERDSRWSIESYRFRKENGRDVW